MRRIPALERNLLWVGFVLLLLALLSLTNLSRIATWIGLGGSADHKVIAQVEKVEKVARRKTSDSPDFTPLVDRQSLFAGDVVTTGPESKVVVLLQNGSYVVIDPNSAVEFQMVNYDGGFDRSIVLDVLKGNASGSGTNSPKILSSRGSKPIPPLPSVAPSVVVATATPTPTAVPPCRFALTSIDPPKEDGFPRAHIDVKCPGAQKITVTVANEQGGAESFDLSGEAGVIDYTPKAPGMYQVSSKQGAGELKIEIPRSYSIAQWSSETPSCLGSLEGKANGLPVTVSQLLNSGGKIVWQKSGREGKTAPLSNTVALPSDLSMKFVLDSGFEVTTPPLRLSQWRDCSFQVLPAEGKRFKLGVNHQILFTWSENKKAKYRFELASDPSFSKVIENRLLEVNYFRMPVTRKGTFYWRVRTEGDLGPIETRSFTIQ